MARSPLYKILCEVFKKSWPLNEKKIARRDFVSGLLATSVVSFQPRLMRFSPKNLSRIKIPSENPLIILGAGVAGLTAAYRLSQAGIACEIYEGSERLGGRILTFENFNKSGQFCEEGAEFIDSSHTHVIGLCKELGVALQDLSHEKTKFEPLLFHIEGHYYTEAEVTEQFQKVSKRLFSDFEKLGIDNRQTFVTYKNKTAAAIELDQLTLEQYLFSLKDEVEAWVLKAVEIAYVGEFGLDACEQSALNLITLIEPTEADSFDVFGNSDESMRISGGSSQLVEALYRKIQHTVPVHFNHRLVAVKDDSLRFEMNFERRLESSFMLKATRVLCTLPFTSLRNVSGLEGLGFSAVKQKAIREMGYGTHSKLIAGFKTRVWRKKTRTRVASLGSAISDTELQAVWETSRMQSGASGILTSFPGGKTGLNLRFTDKLKVLNNLEKTFEGSLNEFDGNTHFANWSQNSLFGGSYACPRPGQYTTLLGSLSEDEINGRFLFAGEHTSLANPGYVEGAVESANSSAAKIIRQKTSAVISRRDILSARIQT